MVLKEVADDAGAVAEGKGVGKRMSQMHRPLPAPDPRSQASNSRFKHVEDVSSRSSIAIRSTVSVSDTQGHVAFIDSHLHTSHLQAQPEQLLTGAKPSLPSPHRPQPFIFPQLMVPQASTQFRQWFQQASRAGARTQPSQLRYPLPHFPQSWNTTLPLSYQQECAVFLKTAAPLRI
ncbi:hypothetical protein D9613_012712 [Agrocybe pediades]|uniref:Uncharacterized protein n=1 Tax=Agrocybe pediades TaxID=84607 RepID=A0A8H4QKG2_9AGAR|nr:hypothetical protein D9613_012712 [Agrocybe pediades]